MFILGFLPSSRSCRKSLPSDNPSLVLVSQPLYGNIGFKCILFMDYIIFFCSLYPCHGPYNLHDSQLNSCLYSALYCDCLWFFFIPFMFWSFTCIATFSKYFAINADSFLYYFVSGTQSLSIWQSASGTWWWTIGRSKAIMGFELVLYLVLFRSFVLLCCLK